MRLNFSQIFFFATIMGGLTLGIIDKTLPLLSTNSVQAMEASTSPSLQSTTWYISGWSGSPVPGSAPITLQFKDNRLMGTAGCNSFNGAYTSGEGNLTIDQALATTRKACAAEVMAQEQKFLQLLTQVTAYSIGDDGQLTLTYLKDGEQGSVTFIPASQYNALHNSQWQLVTMAGVEPITNEENSQGIPQIQFLGDRLAGTGGCNRLMGQFTIDGENLTIDERMASTMMACPEPLMNQEQQFIQALVNAQKYQILTSGELVIDYLMADKTEQLVFLPLMVDPQTQG
ncbi:META domain-containing protein [Synechocystis salina LEGE 06099]|uniref:META domain-containing protein n=1 Tax=Synechocystis salina TaxID=945780 RepID=UPI001882EC1C|nr:META domain-containing protein [Synechocystis salina]MBE9203978.1 META domain-containing protein [Synechocystis salina LEGE 06099]